MAKKLSKSEEVRRETETALRMRNDDVEKLRLIAQARQLAAQNRSYTLKDVFHEAVELIWQKEKDWVVEVMTAQLNRLKTIK